MHNKKRKQKKHGRRRSTPLQSLLQGLFLGFCICLLAFSIWKLATIFIGYSSGDKEYKDLQQYVLSEPETPDRLLPLLITLLMIHQKKRPKPLPQKKSVLILLLWKRSMTKPLAGLRFQGPRSVIQWFIRQTMFTI